MQVSRKPILKAPKKNKRTELATSNAASSTSQDSISNGRLPEHLENFSKTADTVKLLQLQNERPEQLKLFQSCSTQRGALIASSDCGATDVDNHTPWRLKSQESLPLTLYNEFALDPNFNDIGNRSPGIVCTDEPSPTFYLDAKKPRLIMMGETCISSHVQVLKLDEEETIPKQTA